MSKKISVIVPIYNAEKYLRQCLDSIVNQTYANLEILLINDCSTDESLEICNEYANRDERIIIIDKKVNCGAGLSRIAGVEAATGDVIAWVDGDDRIAPEMYNDLLSKMLENNADIIQCKYFFLYDTKLLSTKDIEDIFIYDTVTAIKSLLEHDKIDTSLCNKLFKKKIFTNIEMSERRVSEDSDIVYKLILKSEKIMFFDKSYYYYRQYIGTQSSGMLCYEKAKTIIEIERSKIDYIIENLPELQNLGKSKLFTRYMSVFYSLNNERPECQDILNMIKNETPQLYSQVKKSLKAKKRFLLYFLLISTKPGLIPKVLNRYIKRKYEKNGYRYGAIKSRWYEIKTC